jgi:DNA topoisomerase-1
LNGRWGPYISYKKENYKIPKGSDPKALTFDDCMSIIKASPEKKKKKK